MKWCITHDAQQAYHRDDCDYCQEWYYGGRADKPCELVEMPSPIRSAEVKEVIDVYLTRALLAEDEVARLRDANKELRSDRAHLRRQIFDDLKKDNVLEIENGRLREALDNIANAAPFLPNGYELSRAAARKALGKETT